jgi:putative photosynthetic complex assembly protein
VLVVSGESERLIPRGVLVGAGALIALTVAAAAAARVSGIGTTEPPVSAPVESRELRFEDRDDGAVAVYEAADGATVDVLAPGTNGFVRGVMRGLARERKRQEIGQQPPFRLTRWADGRLTLDDTATGRRIELAAFGPTNTGAFARLLHAGEAAP